uniref:Uncharacterized protein n=1 Tax=Romanomermis culicivorax TaxID=13658 RepID=A0A915ITP4_ROMCU
MISNIDDISYPKSLIRQFSRDLIDRSNKDKQGILTQQAALKSFIRSKVMKVSTDRLFLAHPVCCVAGECLK